MKTKIGSFLIILFILVLAGCDSPIGEESPYGNNVNQLEDVSIEFAENLYNPIDNYFELITTNDSEEEITYGVGYTLDYLNEETWHIVKPNEEVSFILIAHILEPNSESSEEINMTFYEPLNIGQYRLIRQINDSILAAEFSVINP